MSILREAGAMRRVCCDECGEEFEDEFHERQFGAMIAAVKEAGWEVTQEDGEWVHRCPADRGTSGGAARHSLGMSKLEQARKLFGR